MFFWTISAQLQPCENNYIRVSNYRQNFVESNSQSFDFSNGFKFSDKHRFENLNNFSKNKFELNFYQDQNTRKRNLTAIEKSKNESDKVIDLFINKIHYVLIRKLNVILGKQHCK